MWNTTAKPVQKDTQDNKDNKDTDDGKDTEKAMEQAVVLTHLTRHRMPAVTVTEKQLTAEEPVEVRMEMQLRENGSVPRVIVTGFTTDPAEVRAGSNFQVNDPSEKYIQDESQQYAVRSFSTDRRQR